MKQTDTSNLYHHAINKVFSAHRKKDTLHVFKNALDFSTLCYLADGIYTSIKPLHFSIYGNAIPLSISDLGKADTLFKPKSLESEINWVILSIRKYKRELSLFVLLKRNFEKQFLEGAYDSAQKTLETIFAETGYSMWYIEAMFLLLEYQNKSEEQKEFLSEINKTNNNGLISSLANFLSFRTERNLSPYKYDSDINSIFRNTKSKQEKDSREYYLFKLNFYEQYNLDDFSPIVLFENTNSVIDRYLLLRDIFKVLIVKEEFQEFIYSKSRYIFRKTSDPNFLPFICRLNSKSEFKHYFEEKYLRIFDLYYAGLYDEAINDCVDFLNNKEISFDIIYIFVKCHINQKKPLAKINDESNSLLNQIAVKIYDLLNSKTIRNDLLYNLYQINKNILSFDISPGLDNFLKKEQNITTMESLKLTSLCFFDPLFCKGYPEKEQALEYLYIGQKYFPGSIAIKHNINYLNDVISDKDQISEELFSIDNAKILFNKRLFIESLKLWEKISTDFIDNTPIVQTALKYWFECLVKLERFNDCIQLFVEHYLINRNSVTKIDTNSLLDLLRMNRYRNIKRTVNLPIFVDINSNDDAEKSFILEQYCKIFGEQIPSELFDKTLDADHRKIEYFFNEVCSLQTLKHSIYINTTVERLTERIKIINHLIELFPTDSKMYQEELNLVSNELIIYEGTQKLDESKIYANDQAIINYELNEIEGLFSRYKTIYQLTLKDKKIVVVSRNSYAVLKLDGKEKYNESEVKYTDSALLEVFSELFDSILDKYLFSKFGIVAYLSTRIRHGVLLGEIRPEIEKQNLILNRIGNTNTYEQSKTWTEQRCNLSSLQVAGIHSILSEFSLKVDTLIEEIIKSKIQIRINNKNEGGLFNYDFEKAELYTYALDLAVETDVKVFSQKVIDLIWKRTDANLEVIREYIGREIKNRFSEELNNLDKELRNFIQTYQLPQIFTNLVDCSTIIENKLNKISSWFRRSGSTIDDFNIEKLFNIIWNNTSRCYPKVNASIDLSIEYNPTIKSNFYIHFTDLFRIMLDNMFKYGELKDGRKEFYFKCARREDFLICTFANTRKAGKLEIPLKSKDGELMIDTDKLISENKSGVSKAIKIVKFDLGNEENFIRIPTDEGDVFEVECSIRIDNLLRDEKDINSRG